MRVLSFIAFGVLALGLSTIGCSAGPVDDTGTSADEVGTREDVVATAADEGKTVQVPEGHDFILVLDANATTGYTWKVTKTDRSFAYPFSDEYEAPFSTAPAGASGMQILTWRTEPISDVTGQPPVSKSGLHQITVEYRRASDPATAPAAKTISITVEILPGAATPPNNGGFTPGELDNSSCGDTQCGPGSSCQWCWGHAACVPTGALC